MPSSSGTLTSNGQTVSISNVRESVVSVAITGTYTDVEIIFEASLNGATYFPAGLISSERSLITTTSGILTNSTQGYGSLLPMRVLDSFRVRAIAHGGGSMSVSILTTKPLAEPASMEEIIYGQTVVGTAGTAVVLLSGSQNTNTLTITAKDTNTGNIYLGDSGVDFSNGYIIPVSSSISIDQDHALDNLYIDSDNNGDGVSYIGSNIED